MSARNPRDDSLLAIDIDSELRNQIEAAAVKRGMSLRDYVVAALREALDSSEAENESGAWSRLSIPSFRRDWESNADAIYDDLA